MSSDDLGFVRVRKRKLKGGHPGWWRAARVADGTLASTAVSFDLVRAVRINGKPRHVFVFGLGSQKDHARQGDHDLVHFWVHAIRRMHRHKLTPKQRRWLAAELVRKGARLPTIEACWDSMWTTYARSTLKEVVAVVTKCVAYIPFGNDRRLLQSPVVTKCRSGSTIGNDQPDANAELRGEVRP